MDKNDSKVVIDNNSGVVAGNIDNVNYYATTTIKTSIIASVLKIMIDKLEANDYDAEKSHNLSTYDIAEKINYNNVVKYKSIIEKYYSYCYICEDAINKYDNVKPRSKTKILNNVNDRYLLEKGELLRLKADNEKEIDIIRKNADFILDKIKDYYFSQAKDCDVLTNYAVEDVEMNIIALVVYCFVECKILERPVKEKLG